MFTALAVMFSVQLPPPRYDYEPHIPVRVIEATQAQVNSTCRKASRYTGPLRILACAIPGNPCIIIWPRHVKQSGALWRHERAHCNGWVHSTGRLI